MRKLGQWWQALPMGLLLTGLAAGLGVLPFAVLCGYAHPALDDFAYATYFLDKGFGAAQHQLYLSLTGRYTSTLLLTWGSPLSHQWLAGYFVGGAGVLLAWWAALAVLGRELLGPALRWGQAAVGGLALLALSLAQLPSPAEGLYWLAGLNTYLVPTILSIALLALVLRQQRAPARTRGWWGSLGAGLVVLIMGGNEVNGLLVGALLLVASVALPKATARPLWPLLLVAALAGAVAWAAPGNFVRLHSIRHSLGPVALLGRAGLATGYCLLTWLGTGVLPLASLLLAGWVQRWAGQAGTSSPLPLAALARRPVLLTGCVLGALWLSFALGYATLNAPLPLRARNAVYALFVVGWLLMVYSWATWYWRRHAFVPPGRLLVGAVWVWLGLALATDHNVNLHHDRIGVSVNSLMQAYRDWLGGAAARYDQQQRARYALLRRARPHPALLRLDPLRATPPTVFYYDISADERLWGNATYAQYFGWPAIYVAAPGAPR